MKNIKNLLVAFMLITMVSTIFTSCKKGTDDPIVSLKTRKDRFVNTWTLNKYEKDGITQNMNGSTYTYVVLSNGTLTRSVEGDIFGFPTKKDDSGTWSFINDDEDVNISINSVNSIYNIQRLATKELWLKHNDGTNTYVYYFIGN
ncbi:MAG: hypothetical protein Q8K70_07275 [Bacteroidota bacterium]|nr:hypothetical protein [Bacteroidota bacterium]